MAFTPAPLRQYIGKGTWSMRVSGLIGGNERAGAFYHFPLGQTAYTRAYHEWLNDFNSINDLYTTAITLTGTATGGNGTLALSGTTTPDWLITTNNSPSNAAGTIASLLTATPYGVARLDAGTTDTSGNQLTRAQSGTNLGGQFQLTTSAPTVVNSLVTRQLRGMFGCRFKLTETGTADQSAIQIGMARDEAAQLTTAGALATAGAGAFGFYKPIGSHTMNYYCKNTTVKQVASTTTSANGAAVTITPGTFSEFVAVVYKLGNSATANNLIMDIYKDGVYADQFVNSGGTTTIPADGQYAPVFNVFNGTGADCTLDIDYIWTLQTRS